MADKYLHGMMPDNHVHYFNVFMASIAAVAMHCFNNGNMYMQKLPGKDLVVSVIYSISKMKFIIDGVYHEQTPVVPQSNSCYIFCQYNHSFIVSSSN